MAKYFSAILTATESVGSTQEALRRHRKDSWSKPEGYSINVTHSVHETEERRRKMGILRAVAFVFPINHDSCVALL